jgi:hypothetical protein
MHSDFLPLIKQATGADQLELTEIIQELWSGYGTIRRYRLTGAARQQVIVKHICVPEQQQHPRGWDTDLSHQRKLRSYQVERCWYADWHQRCPSACRVPECLAIASRDDETLLVLEDLDAAGYPERRESLSEKELLSCIAWLAHFHANFLGQNPDGLWPQGTYWHLATRPDELAALTDLPLKNAAATIDRMLRECPYQTLVHGDAKLANFCFSTDGQQVAAVDFQYVGGGCGMQDLAYFIGSCLSEQECEAQESWLLDQYFTFFKTALETTPSELAAAQVEASWRPLFPVAWTDFHRFLKGWSPGHWKINSYSERLVRELLSQLKRENT